MQYDKSLLTLPDSEEERDELFYKLDALRSMDLMGRLTITFDFETGVLTNVGWLPLSRTEAKALLLVIEEHLSKTPKQLHHAAVYLINKYYPGTLEQNPPKVEDYI